MSAKGKLVVSLLRALQKILNKDVKVGDLQSKYNATKGRILRLYISDMDAYANFKIEDGKVDLVHCDEPNATVSISLNTLLLLIKGSMTVEEQDGTPVTHTYTPFDAWRRGELVIETSGPNETWLSDLTLFGKEVYAEAFPALRSKLGSLLGGK